MFPPRGFLSKASILAASMMFVVGALEAGLRLAGFDPIGEYGAGRELVIQPSESEELVYELKPGAVGRIWDCDVEINSAGFRDREYGLEKPEGFTRIVALGDSITFGNQLAVEDSWPERLERRLRTGGTRAEVLNFGVGGYDTAQEVELYARKAQAFRPDHVVLCFCVNDVATVSVNLHTIQRANALRGAWSWSRILQFLYVKHGEQALIREMQAEREAEEIPDGPLPEDPILEGMQAELASVLSGLDLPDDRRSRVCLEHLNWYCNPARLARVRAAFERLAELTQPTGTRVHLFVVPYLDEGPDDVLTKPWALAYALLRHEGERVGFRFIDLRAELEGEKLASLRISGKDRIHPSARAHRKIAVLLADELAGIDSE